jgi:selT/selW/selH-like putative selenoprotein
VAGGGGVFDVHVDGELIYSKFQTGRFPQHQEVVDELTARSA